MFRPDRDPWFVTGWDVKEFSYCPVIPWVRANYGVVEPPTYSMGLGRDVGRGVREGVARRLNLPRPWRFEVFVEVRGEGLSGVVDVLAGRSWFAVVEVKAFRRSSGFEHFRDQLFFYSYIVSRVFGPVREAYLVLGGRVFRYLIDERVVGRVRELVRRVREVKGSPRPPTPRPGFRCSFCWYRRYCPLGS